MPWKKADMETLMLRVLIVCLVIVVAAFLAAWALPEGTVRQLFQVLGAIFVLIIIFLGPLALLQWLSPPDSDPSNRTGVN
jgi:Zn-dependent protease with chaperone function